MTQQNLISDQDKAQLKRTFRKDLKGNVKLRVFTQKPSVITIPGRECRYCAETQHLMEEVADLSTQIDLEVIDFYANPKAAEDQGVARVPAVILSSANMDKRGRLKFYGAPIGYEMATIIEGIKTISRGVSPLSMDTRRKLRQVNQDVHIQVFVTPSCPYCPALSHTAHAMALENSHIYADVIEVQEFPRLGQTYGVRSVPLTVINEHIRFAGAVGEGELLERVLEAGVRTGSDGEG